jgi:thymidine kinase
MERRLGVKFAAVDGNGQADIVGVDERLMVEFSTRSVDIESELDDWVSGFVEREGRRPTAAETGKAHKTITLATRPAKPDEAGCSTTTLREGWRARADEIVDVDRMLDRVLAHPPSPAVIVRPTVDAVLAAAGEKHAEWAEPQLIEQIAMRVTGPDPITVAATIEAVRIEAMASAGVVDLTPPPGPGDVLRASDGRPVSLPPSAVGYTRSSHLLRELDIVEWATSTDTNAHHPIAVENAVTTGLDDSQTAAVTALLADPRPVITVVGPAGAGKTRMLAVAVTAWQANGVNVFGVGPSASAARELHDGAGTVADTLHKLVYEHSTKQQRGLGPACDRWRLPERSVVIIDEAGMVDTRLLHEYSKIAGAQNWRTILVGDHYQLDAVDAGGMFAELVNDADVVTAELDTLHRFDNDWEAKASLALRSGNASAIETYEQHGRIYGHERQLDAIEATAATAVAGVIEGGDVLVMAPTNAVVDSLNEVVTEQLLAVGQLSLRDRIDIDGRVFYPGQPVVTRSNDRTLTYGSDADEWVRNGDRWTIDAGTRDELYLTNADNGHHIALPADYVAEGNLAVGYASTINRAQGATVEEAHVIIDERTNAKQLYVGMTRGRNANHVHTAPPAFDPDHHGPLDSAHPWTPTDAVVQALQRQPDHRSAISRRRQLREMALETQTDRMAPPSASTEPVPGDEASARVSAAMRRLQSLARRPSQGLER